MYITKEGTQNRLSRFSFAAFTIKTITLNSKLRTQNDKKQHKEVFPEL